MCEDDGERSGEGGSQMWRRQGEQQPWWDLIHTIIVTKVDTDLTTLSIGGKKPDDFHTKTLLVTPCWEIVTERLTRSVSPWTMITQPFPRRILHKQLKKLKIKMVSILRPVWLPTAASAWRDLYADAKHEPGLVQPIPQRDQQDPCQARHQVDPPHR